MNDFTKEELLDLYCIVEEFCQTDGIITSEVATKLGFRIASMIDNYCEHIDKVSSTDDDGHIVIQCGRSHLVLWHDKD